MATYLAHDALRLPAASLLANSGMCVNIEIKIWLLLGVNVDTAFKISAIGIINIVDILPFLVCVLMFIFR